MYDSVIIVLTTFSISFPFAFSNLSAYSERTFATIVLIAAPVVAGVELDPGILNSNLFPVKANGDVLFLSPASLSNAGNTSTPNFNLDIACAGDFLFNATSSNTSVN